MNYRKDIDGLRSIAVSLVVLHHAGVAALPGGYVGVDVFFVISGYLITGIIYQQVLNDKFSFSEFFIRRIRRLMPALFAVVFATIILSLIFLFPSDLVRFGWSLLWVAFYLGNIFFWREHGGYFFENTQEAPLLHTWSLAVEEQYYLIWPLYVYFGLKLLGFRNFGILTVVGFIAAVFFSEWATQNTIGAAYYLLPTRFFELMIGSLLAIFWTRLPLLNTSLNHALSLIGLALIAASSVILTPASSFPGFNALYPALGAALLLLSGKNSLGIGNLLLAQKPFVAIGLISYSLYLWHWPIFVFIRYTSIELTFVVQTLAISTSILLAYLSWRFVETPFRKPTTGNLAQVSIGLIGKPVALICGIVATIVFTQGWQNRFAPDIASMDAALNAKPHRIRSSCHVANRNYTVAPSDECLLGNLDSSGSIDGFMFGDSHANHISGFIDEVAKDAGKTFQDYTMDQCPPIFEFAWGRTNQVATNCLERNNLAQKYIEENNFEFVVLSASWPYPMSDRLFKDNQRLTNPNERLQEIKQKIAYTIDTIQNAGATVILFDDISSVVDEDPRCPIKKAAYDESRTCETQRIRNTAMEAIFEEIGAEYDSVIRVMPSELFCDKTTCKLSISGIPLYHDTDHLNEIASKRLGLMFLENNLNPLN